MLNQIRKTPHLDVRVHEDDVPDVAEVDGKLIKLAAANCISAAIITTMFLMLQWWHVISIFHWPCEADTIQTRLRVLLKQQRWTG